MAKGYVIAFYKEVKDADRLAAYAPLATKAIAEAGGRILARGGRVKALEAGIEERTVVIEFDSFETACTYYDGDAYQAALEALGADAVVRELRAVEGAD